MPRINKLNSTLWFLNIFNTESVIKKAPARQITSEYKFLMINCLFMIVILNSVCVISL